MKKVLIAATLALALSPTSKVLAQAQTVQYGTEVCVNASQVNEAKRRFPNATLHVIPDSVDAAQNGWRLVSGAVGPNGRIMTDAQEVELRKYESSSMGLFNR